MERFIHPDQLPDAPGGHKIIQIRHRLALHQLPPLLTLRKDGKEIGHIMIHRNPVRIHVVGKQEQEAVPGLQNIPHLQIGGGRCQLSVIVIHEIAVAVHIEMGRLSPAEQAGLISLPLGSKALDCFFRGDPAAKQGDIPCHDPADLFFQHSRRKILCSLHLNVQCRANGAVHLCPCFRPQLPQCQKQDKLGGAGVHLTARRVSIAQQMYHASRCRHCPADGGAVCRYILTAYRDIV